nr:phospholipid scramblase 1-like isoform X1 [Pogona vitticeps]
MESKENAPVLQPPPYPGTEPAPHYPPPVSQVPYGSTGYMSGPVVTTQPAFAYQYHPASSGLVPLQSQPAAPVVWMPAPPVPPKCPPGLEYLTQIDRIVVEQQMDLLEALSRFETLNRYEIRNSLGQRIYFAQEENDEYSLQCHGSLRGFVIKLFDSTNQPVMQLSRECRCDICCCPCICCLQELEVQAPLGTVIGYVKQKWHPCLPKFDLQNETRESLLKMKGPCVPCQCYRDVHFEVKPLDETATIGIVTKQWTGMAREAIGSASLFGIQFPLDLDVKMKALVLGTCILLDFMFFDHRAPRRDNNS